MGLIPDAAKIGEKGMAHGYCFLALMKILYQTMVKSQCKIWRPEERGLETGSRILRGFALQPGSPAEWANAQQLSSVALPATDLPGPVFGRKVAQMQGVTERSETRKNMAVGATLKVVRIAIFSATQQMGDFSFKHRSQSLDDVQVHGQPAGRLEPVKIVKDFPGRAAEF